MLCSIYNEVLVFFVLTRRSHGVKYRSVNVRRFIYLCAPSARILVGRLDIFLRGNEIRFSIKTTEVLHQLV